MAKGGKLSFKSIVDCFKSAKSDSDRVSCKKYFAKKYKPESEKGRERPKPMNDKESKVWSKYIGQGSLARSRMDKNEKTILDSLIKDKLKRLED
jgi:hypothetical protein